MITNEIGDEIVLEPLPEDWARLMRRALGRPVKNLAGSTEDAAAVLARGVANMIQYARGYQVMANSTGSNAKEVLAYLEKFHTICVQNPKGRVTFP